MYFSGPRHSHPLGRILRRQGRDCAKGVGMIDHVTTFWATTNATIAAGYFQPVLVEPQDAGPTPAVRVWGREDVWARTRTGWLFLRGPRDATKIRKQDGGAPLPLPMGKCCMFISGRDLYCAVPPAPHPSSSETPDRKSRNDEI